MVFSPGLEQFDPALLAFVKCHITSPVKWDVLRVLASQEGAWVGAEQLARTVHRPASELAPALSDLSTDGVVEMLATGAESVSYRLPADEPTSVVLHRLIDAATHSLELRAIIAAHLQHIRHQSPPIRSPAAA
jgi:DNA-binding IclR family transcriptional regulator